MPSFQLERAAAEASEKASRLAKNPFLLFCNAKREELRAANPGASIVEMSKVMAEAWAELSEPEQLSYADGGGSSATAPPADVSDASEGEVRVKDEAIAALSTLLETQAEVGGVDLSTGVRRRSLGVRSTLKHAISDAIRIGAPTYNRGDYDGCAFIYRRTMEEIVDRCDDPDVVARITRALNEASTASDRRGSASGAAWVMRRCFDSFRGESRNVIIASMVTADDLWAEREVATPPPFAEQPSLPGLVGGRPPLRDAGLFSARSPGLFSSVGVEHQPASVKAAIRGAISIGAGVYDRGDRAGCAYIYRRTAEEIVADLAGTSACLRLRRPCSQLWRHPIEDGFGSVPTRPLLTALRES